MSYLPAIFIKGAIVSNDLDTIPKFKVYYNGVQSASDEEGFFTIPVDEQRQDLYHILISKDFEQKFDSVNTIKELSVALDKPNRFFKVKRADVNSIQKELDNAQKDLKTSKIKLQLISKQVERQGEFIEFFESKRKPEKYLKRVQECKDKIKKLNASKLNLEEAVELLKRDISFLKEQHKTLQKVSGDAGGDIWMIKEKQISGEYFALPENCLIVCMNPKIVDYVDNWKFFMPNNFVCMPRIVLKKNLEQKNVKNKRSVTRSAIKSELYSLDKNVFHEVKKEQMQTFPDRPELRARLTV